MTNGQVKTMSGVVRGVDDGGVSAFKGIPYGGDTSGDGRFRPPRLPRPWSGVYEAGEYGPSCPQMTLEQMLGIPMSADSEVFMGTRTYERVMGEDCLVLNVWTPAAETTAGFPVLVWLHGGAWSTGSASWPLYDFTNLARHGNTVVVGVNHRIGILGFLDLSSNGEEFADSGNVGMLDIVAALRWIHENIAGFGGDPNNVTVFGESGGGAKTATLLAMPAARGLFHKAAAMSGSMLFAQEHDSAAANTQTVLDYLDLGSDTEELETVSVERLVEAEVALPGRTVIARGRGFSPVLGPSLPRHPALAIRAGDSANVALLSGCNSDEMLAFLFNDPDLWTLTIEDLPSRLRPLLGDDAGPVLARYRESQPDESATSLLIAVATDALFRMPQIRLAEAHVQGGAAATYMYIFTWGFEDPSGRVRAPHGIDMPYFFDNVDKAPMAAGPHADALVAAMSGALVAFAHSGTPTHESLPVWPRYTLDQRTTMRFDIPAILERDPFEVQRQCWSGVDLPGLRGG